MANRKIYGNDGEWAVVIKAQDETSKKVLQEEQDLQKQGKLRYKEELDKQLEFKSKIMKNQMDNKQDELSFHKAQALAMRDYENSKKNEDRSYMRIFMNNNQVDLDKKYQQQQSDLEVSKILERDRVRMLQLELENEKRLEMINKNKRVQEEQEELQRQQMEKLKRAQMEGIEKLKDKDMIDKKIEQMKGLEASYKEFYEKRTKSLENKMKLYQPYVDSNNYKQELIRKRNEEWESLNNKKIELKEKAAADNRVKVINQLKSELEKQIEEKQRLKELELNEGKKEQIIAITKAREEEIERTLERYKRLRERDELKRVYEQQLTEREKLNLQSKRMDSRERLLHNEMLMNLNQNKVIAFPGVPGIHLKESPIKQTFNRVYPAENQRKTQNSYANDDYRIPKQSLTPPPYLEVSKSYEYSSFSKNYAYPDPHKHNPITNPLGSYLPRVLPGERIIRVLNSHSKLALAGNALFK